LGRLVGAHFEEERRAEPGALGRFEELLGDDHVGVDIDHWERRRDAGECRKGLHGGGT
jgi:hypothetical protein